jgi:hypothetical protein
VVRHDLRCATERRGFAAFGLETLAEGTVGEDRQQTRLDAARRDLGRARKRRILPGKSASAMSMASLSSDSRTIALRSAPKSS